MGVFGPRLGELWRGLRGREVYPWSVLGALLALLGYRRSLLDPTPLRRLLERHFPVMRLENTTIPCYVTATDALSGDEVSITTGSVADALLASAAIPALFPPVESAGRFLIDGGVASNTPISTAISKGASRVVVLATGFSCAVTEPPRGVVGRVLHSFNLLVARQLVVDLERYRACADTVVVPPLCPLDVSSYDFSHAEALIADPAGRAVGRYRAHPDGGRHTPIQARARSVCERADWRPTRSPRSRAEGCVSAGV